MKLSIIPHILILSLIFAKAQAYGEMSCDITNYKEYIYSKEKTDQLITQTGEGCYLQGADLQGADLKDANLRGANLQGADLQYADLENVNLQGANLQHTISTENLNLRADIEELKLWAEKFIKGLDN